MAICECGHSRDLHGYGEDTGCMRAGCNCRKYRKRKREFGGEEGIDL